MCAKTTLNLQIPTIVNDEIAVKEAIRPLKNAGLNMGKPSDWVVFNQQLG